MLKQPTTNNLAIQQEQKSIKLSRKGTNGQPSEGTNERANGNERRDGSASLQHIMGQQQNSEAHLILSFTKNCFVSSLTRPQFP
jgi:hypothetical protein